jgi:hypothetical protein
MGVDITLRRVQAYRTGSDEIIITVSQHYPPPDVQEFLVAPVRSTRRRRTPDLPEVEWSESDLRRLATEVSNATIHATLDLCAAQPGEWIPTAAIQAVTGREATRHRGDYGGFAITLRTRFERSNPPFRNQWAYGGTHEQYYVVTPEIAQLWIAARANSETTGP